MPARFLFAIIRGVMDTPAKVILLRTTGTAVSLSADAAKLPRRIKVLNWGDNPNCHGKRVNVGPLFVKCLAAETYPYRKVALDFEHNTFPGTAAYKESQEPRAVAGFGTIEAVEGEGVFITMTSWTPEGEKMAVNYADVSAGAVTDKEGNLVAVASVALCRAGAVDGMDFVEAPLSGDVSSALSGIINNNQKKGKQDMDYKAMLLKLLGLGEDATDEAIQAALDAFGKKPKGGEQGTGNGEQDAALSAAVKAAVAEAVKPIEEKVAALSAAAENHEKQDLLGEAAREGKVVALGADALAKISVADLKATIEKTPVTVPLSARTPGNLREQGTGNGEQVSEEMRQIALNCGVSPDIFKK
jgi:phage I-like protein